MRSTFFYTIAIAFASGIFVRSFFDIGFEEVVWLLLLCFVCALLWRQSRRDVLSPLFLSSLALLFLALGVLRLEVTDRDVSPLEVLVAEEVTVKGVVVREPDVRRMMVHLYVQLSETNELVLVTTDKYQEFQYGDRVVAEGELQKPEAFETDLGRMFNYSGYLKARGVSYMIPFAETEVVSRDEGNAFSAYLLDTKHRFMNVVEKIVPEPEAGLGEGVLLGVKRALGEDLEEAFRRVGIIHIVVLSGYNIMLVAEALGRLLSFLYMPRLRMVIGILGIASFALLVGLSATVVRASVMAGLVLIARATGRTYAILRALMLAGVMMLLLNPYLLAFDPGFQLSFLATLGLIVLAPLIEKRFHLVPTKFKIREFLTATIATQIFVLPLLLYQIGEISIVSVVVNVLVLPMVPFAMLLTFAVGSVGGILPLLGTFFGFFAHVSLSYIITIAELFAALPFAASSVPVFPFVLVILLYGALGYVIMRWQQYETKKTEEPSLPTTVVTDESDDLAEWTIEEEKENFGAQENPKQLKDTSEEKTPFPFS